jgi:hypothetical protein
VTEPAASLRIWVALDQSPRGAAALAAATELAADLDAELAGLFVEDIDLQHLFGLPFAREYSLLWGGARPLSQTEMERAWRREAEALQQRLAEAAERQRLRWSFRIARGRLSAEVATLTQALDLVVLGQRSGVSVRSVATARLQGPAVPQPAPVLVLFEDVAASARSLDAAARLARRSGTGLVLLVRAADDAAYAAACEAAQAELRVRGASGRCTRLEALDGPRLAEAAQREHAACVVLAAGARLAGGARFERTLDEIECPVVLTR